MNFSCNVTYYNEPHHLKWWYDTIKMYNEEGYNICLNLADDGSMREPAEKFFEKNPPTDKMSLYRVIDDIGFNSHGARNLLMKQTQTEWNMLSDIDRQYPHDTILEIAVSTDKRKGEYYKMFSPNSKKYTLNEYVIHKDDFWRSGGYDEEFVNIHWGDRLFFETSLDPVCRKVERQEWWCNYTRGARNVSDGDVETTQYPDDDTLINPNTGPWSTNAGRKALKDFVRDRNATPQGRLSKPVLNFEWTQIF